MTDLSIMVLSTIGALFILLACIGMVRMPDFYLRMSVTTKAATMGIGLILISTAIYFDLVAITSRVFAIIFFLFLTAPIAAHMISRASYFTGVKLWHNSVIDELSGKYIKKTHELRSDDSMPDEVPTQDDTKM